MSGVLGPLILAGAGLGTSLLNTIFAGAVASYLTVHAASARILGTRALGGLALAQSGLKERMLPSLYGK